MKPKPPRWERTDVSDWELAGEEPQGMDEHPWLRHVARDRPWLFKEAKADDDRSISEDIVEKIASGLAAALGIPAAKVDLVTRGASRGCIVETLRPSKWGIYPGQVAVGAAIDEYDSRDPEHRGYNLDTIRGVLTDIAPPPSYSLTETLTAFEVFTGYLLFDALIANTDRHDKNWSILTPPPGHGGANALCGSYDHASSLAFNTPDSVRERTLMSGSIDAFARRASARQFEHRRGARRRSLVDIAREGVERCTPQGVDHWRQSFLSVDRGQLETTLISAPIGTDIAHTFTLELLDTNRRRVLHALG